MKSNSLRWLGFQALLVAALAWGGALAAHRYVLRPIQERQSHIASESAVLDERLAEAKSFFKQVQALEQKSKSARSELANFQQAQPTGSPHAWLPTSVKSQLQDSNISNVTLRSDMQREVRGLPTYTQMFWAMEIPVTGETEEIRATLAAILEIESVSPFIRISDLSIGPDPGDPQRRVAKANIALLARKL